MQGAEREVRAAQRKRQGAEEEIRFAEIKIREATTRERVATTRVQEAIKGRDALQTIQSAFATQTSAPEVAGSLEHGQDTKREMS